MTHFNHGYFSEMNDVLFDNYNSNCERPYFEDWNIAVISLEHLQEELINAGLSRNQIKIIHSPSKCNYSHCELMIVFPENIEDDYRDSIKHAIGQALLRCWERQK